MKRTGIVLGIITVSLLLISLASSIGHADEKVTILKYSNFFPPVHKVSLLSEQWCKEVEKRTHGRVKVNYFPGSSLTGPTETYDSVIKGIADIGWSFCSYTRGRFPLSEVVDLPLGYKSGSVGTNLANAYYERFKPKEFDDVKVLYLLTSPPHQLFTKVPVHNLEELRGLKIRSTGTSAKVIGALGGVAVAMPMSEAYDALKRGVAEGIICPFEPLKGFKLVDVVNHATLFDSAYVNMAYVIMNKEKWNSLPADIQKIIEQIDREWIEKQGKLWDELEAEGRAFFLKKGNKVIQLSKEENARWTEKLKPILAEYVEQKKAMGLPAGEALEFCLDYLKTHQK